MKAILCTDWSGYKALQLGEIDRPAHREGCVRIGVRHATVGYGQMLVVAGRYQRRPPLPFVPGTEVAGVILDAPEATGFRPGDRVAASLDWGGYAEEALATPETVWHVPPGLALHEAASIPLTYGTSWAALQWRAQLQPNETLVVFGAAGGVGLTAIEIGKLLGARVIAVASTPDKLAIAHSYGADEGLLHTEPDLGRRIKALTQGRGADVIYDPVGGSLFPEAIRAAAPEARILVIGFASGEIPQIPANLLLVKNLNVIGFNLGLYIGWGLVDERVRYAPRLRTMVEALFEHTRSGRLRPYPGLRLPMDRYQEAFAAIESRQSVGRVVLDIA